MQNAPLTQSSSWNRLKTPRARQIGITKVNKEENLRHSSYWTTISWVFFIRLPPTFPLFIFIYLIFNWRLITLQYCGGFCPTFTWISLGCTCVPHPDPPYPHPIPQGHPSTSALSTLLHALSLDWWSISHIVIYMFQCYSLKSSHRCFLPQSPTFPLNVAIPLYAEISLFWPETCKRFEALPIYNFFFLLCVYAKSLKSHWKNLKSTE